MGVTDIVLKTLVGFALSAALIVMFVFVVDWLEGFCRQRTGRRAEDEFNAAYYRYWAELEHDMSARAWSTADPFAGAPQSSSRSDEPPVPPGGSAVWPQGVQLSPEEEEFVRSGGTLGFPGTGEVAVAERASKGEKSDGIEDEGSGGYELAGS